MIMSLQPNFQSMITTLKSGKSAKITLSRETLNFGKLNIYRIWEEENNSKIVLNLQKNKNNHFLI